MIQKQREELNLKIGDTAYFISNFDNIPYDMPQKVTITEECEEGYGYEAVCESFKSESDPEGRLHTCNGTLYKTKKDARAALIPLMRAARERWAQKQAHANHCIKYIDWVLSRGGRW